jgi:hypothetical protein
MGKSSQSRIGCSLLRVGAAFVALSVLIRPLAAAPEDEVRATFDSFVAAQNRHDGKAVEGLLLASPNFLWITRGTSVWGVDAAMKRFATLYQGTWRLDPEADSLKVIMLGGGRGPALCPDHVYDRAVRSIRPADPLPDEPSAGKDGDWLENIQHPPDTGTYAVEDQYRRDERSETGRTRKPRGGHRRSALGATPPQDPQHRSKRLTVTWRRRPSSRMSCRSPC